MSVRKLLAYLGWATFTFGLCQPVSAQAAAGTVAQTRTTQQGVEYGTIADPLLRQVIPAPQTRNGVIDAGWWSRHERDLAELSASGPVHLLFVGDSITDNYRKSGPAPDQIFKPTWDELFAPHGALNLGVSGDSTQHVMWRLEHGEVDGIAPDDIVALIGTNNTWHDSQAPVAAVAEGIDAVVLTLHAKLPKARILVLGILPSAVSAEKSTKDIAINRLVTAEFAQSRFVRTLDLSSIFLQADGALNTSLFYDPALPSHGKAVHPNTLGQRKMAQAVAKALYGG